MHLFRHSSFGLFQFQSFPTPVFNMPSNAAVAAASAAFRTLVQTLYGIPIPEGHEQSALESIGAIVGNLINTVGQDSAAFKKAEAEYARIVPAWTDFCNARAAAAAAAVAAASAAFRTLFQEVYDVEVAEGAEQSALESCGAIVSNLIDTVGPNSDAFKDAAAKYALIVPAWTAFCDARAAV